MKINQEMLTAEISLMENAVYIIIDGQPTKITAKSFGEDTIVWQNGKVLDVIRSERVRISQKRTI
ncbi:DUF3954 domain-containing protein [Domibacillus sp.]|uniref:DUF3954 domain-containing protein n=1 Tax=Domibacillus sp. TaxID=1969783 RepID=UPI00281279A1|nr:DUF3954 domain-containing protein [Domibacillus sp.]